MAAVSHPMSLQLEKDTTYLDEARPKPQQLVLSSTHTRAQAVGEKLLSAYLRAESAKKERRGLFRRRSTKSHQTRSQRWQAEKSKKLLKAQSERWSMNSVELPLLEKEERSLEAAAQRFHAMLLLYQAFLTSFAETDGFVFQLAGMRRKYLELKGMNRHLDAVVAIGRRCNETLEEDAASGPGVDDTPRWLQQLDAEREREEAELSAKATKNTLPFTRSMQGHEPMEALTLLKYEIDFFKTGNTSRHLASMKKVFFSVVRSSNGRVSRIPDWYIPPYTLHYMREVLPGIKGPVGTAHHGKWVNRKLGDGKNLPTDKDDGGSGAQEDVTEMHDVVVKRLFIHADAIEVFRQEVEIWFALENQHILKLYGASHCSNPALLICEDAKNGPLTEYLALQVQFAQRSHKHCRPKFEFQNIRHALWSLLLEVAEGLRFLHEDHKLVHGNLKCNNILVTEYGHVKLTDFGLGMLMLQNQAVQDKKFDVMGWRAPECRSKFGRPTFMSDVYSLGLCVLGALQAVQQSERSMGHHSSVAGRRSRSGSQSVPRPTVGDIDYEPLDEGMTGLDTLEWGLVTRMCQKEPKDRAPLSAVIISIRNLRERAAVRSSSECCLS